MLILLDMKRRTYENFDIKIEIYNLYDSVNLIIINNVKSH